MSGIVVTTGNIDLAGFFSFNETLLVFGVFVFIFALVFVVDFCVYIEEGVRLVPAALATMTLGIAVVR